MSKHNLSFRLIACAIIAILFLSGSSHSAKAQNRIRIQHVVDKEARGSAPYLGRDYWFAVPQNYQGANDAKKDYEIYITSPKNTVANIQITGKGVVKKPITAGVVLSYKLFPSEVEINSSSDVEVDKAIHVWSDNADLSVYFMSRNQFTSDGMYCIPSTGWGKEYVVASYASLLYGGQGVDLPSEFAIVGNQNNTLVTVIPTQDIRQSYLPDAIAHKKGIPFTLILNRGECVQFQVTRVQSEQWDLTGTVVTGTNPIGIMGASQCPFIPPSDPYCDHILDMIPPVRTWSNTYYTVPFAGRKYGGDSFLIVGSQNGQVILRNGAQAAALARFETHSETDIAEASIWTSTAPFLVVQYINSATHSVPQGSPRNTGDPAMVVINPAEQFAKTVIFQTPVINAASGQPKFTHYVNVVLPTTSEANTKYDGKALNAIPSTQIQRLAIPGTQWEGIRISYTGAGLGEGAHVIKSDTGVGVYLYGYSTDDSYAWAGALGTRTPNDPDTIPPVVVPTSDCFCATISTNDIHPNASKLSSIVVDSLFNTTFDQDPDFVPGSGADSSFYHFCILDSSQEAYIAVSIYDIAGNRTTVTSTYKPQYAGMSPDPLNFGTGSLGLPSFKYDTIYNRGQNPFDFKGSNLHLKNGVYYFVDSTGADGQIPVGGFRIIKLKFIPQVGTTVTDSLSFGDECTTSLIRILGNGGSADFLVNPFDFDCSKPTVTKSSSGYKGGFLILNNSGGDVIIDSIYLSSGVNFGYDKLNPATNTFPFVVPKQNTLSGSYEVVFTFTPQALVGYTDTAHFHGTSGGKDIGWHTAVLSGDGCAPLTASTDNSANVLCASTYVFTIPLTNTGNQLDSIAQVVNVGPQKIYFSIPSLTDYLGNPVTLPTSLDTSLERGMTATVVFTPPLKASGTFIDTVNFIRPNGEIAARSILTVVAKYPEGTVTKGTAQFGILAFGGSVKEDLVTLCNNSKDAFMIDSVAQLASPDSASFALSKKYEVGGTQVSLPYNLQPGECIDIYVTFDPSKSTVKNQLGNFSATTDACIPVFPLTAQAEVTVGPPAITGVTYPAVLSCLTPLDSIHITNPLGNGKEVTNITFTGLNPANFAYQGTYPIPLPVNSITGIPVVFLPNPSMGVISYSAFAKATMRDTATGEIYIDSAVVSGTGAGMNVQVTSVMAELAKTDNEYVKLPINITYVKEGSITTPVSSLDIKRIDLVYDYNTDMLHINPTKLDEAVINRAPGWSLDLANSKVDDANHQLRLSFTSSTQLQDAIGPLATIVFLVTLPKQDTLTDVVLSSSKFYTSANVELPQCANISNADSNFTLLLRCGDATLQGFMQTGKIGMRIDPIHPNPVDAAANGVIIFRYATRFEGNVTISIVDELGVEVAHPVSNMWLPAGEYLMRYKTSSLPSGSYIVRGSLDGVSVSRRFVVKK